MVEMCVEDVEDVADDEEGGDRRRARVLVVMLHGLRLTIHILYVYKYL